MLDKLAHEPFIIGFRGKVHVSLCPGMDDSCVNEIHLANVVRSGESGTHEIDSTDEERHRHSGDVRHVDWG